MFVRLIALGLLAPALAEGAVVESGDGLRLELSDSGQVTGLQIGTVALPLTGAGGFAIADFQKQPAPVNLVPNPSFENDAAGWRLAKSLSVDHAVFHSGKTSLRIDIPGPGPATSADAMVVVPVKPNTHYRVGMWVRRQQVGVCGAYSSERDAEGRPSGKQGQTGVGIPRQDGVWLPLSWDVLTEPRTRQLLLRANIYRSAGTLWVDDYFIEEVQEGVYQPVPGRLTASGRQTLFQGELAESGLRLQATFQAMPECVRIDGLLQDTSGADRAVGLKFALPWDAAGWTWHHDAEEREVIQPGAVCRRTYKCMSGIGVCSIYPWAAISGPAAGLSLAIPLAQGPRVFLLEHDAARRETALIFFVGLARDAGHHPSRAPFSLVLYRHDPAWGMRSAMQRYYRLFPESFVKRPAYEGYLNYAGAEEFDAARHQLIVYQKDRLDDASDFGEGYKFLSAIHGCYDFRQVPYDDPRLPPDEIVFSLLRGMAERERNKPRYYVPTEETMKKIVFGAKGQIGYISDTRYWRPHEGYNGTDQAGWGFNFRVNEDPDVSAFVAELSRRKAEDYARGPDRRPWDATFTADAIEGYFANTAGLDYRREHFRSTLVPLTFGAENLRPAMPNTIWDFHHKAWWPITQQFQIVTYGNANGYEQFFTMPFVDVPMTEGCWDAEHPGRFERFLRAVNYRKIWRHWHAWDRRGYADQDPARVQAHFRSALASAVYPAVACVQSTTGDLEPHRGLYRQYVPAIEELSRAGWDPVPYAQATGDVIVERFGRFDEGDLHLTLRNYAPQPVRTTVTLDRAALGIPADARLCWADILPGAPQVSDLGSHEIPLAMDADGAAALWIGTRSQAARHGFALAAATLEKLERLFHREMGASAKIAWAKAVAAARAGSSAPDVEALPLANLLQYLAGQLQESLHTQSPVDLAKLVFRVKCEASWAPAALLEIDIRAPRLTLDAQRGGATTLKWVLTAGAHAGLSRIRARALSPWPAVAGQCRVEPTAASLAQGRTIALAAELAVPAEPPRRLLPFLLEVHGQAGTSLFTLSIPVDVAVAAPIEVTIAQPGVVRGRRQTLQLRVLNRLPDTMRATLRFTSPGNVRLDPPTVPLSAAGGATMPVHVELTLDKSVPIGPLRLTYAVESSDPRFRTGAPLLLKVDEP
jgi:hypothetical protein